ncbi:MAG: eIF2A-related protein, partial [Halothece sp.]
MPPIGVKTSHTKRTQSKRNAHLWIILVGVNTYQDEQFPSLQFSALDCQGLAEALEDGTELLAEKQLRIYHDFASETPELKTILNSLEEVVQKARSEDTLLFYFSGHGMLDPKTQQAVLCLADTRKDALLTTGLKLSELLHLFSQCSAHQQLVWLDACHSGGMTLRLNPTSQLVEALQQQAQKSQGFYALLSCDRGQQSWEFPELGHGVFTYYLICGLKGEAADEKGAIAVDSLYRYVYHQTLQYIDKTNQQLRLINQQKRDRGETKVHTEYPLQTPKRIVEGVGEVVLGRKRESCELKPTRQALVIEGLSSPKTSLALSKLLRRSGQFSLQYFPQPGKEWSEIRGEIKTYFNRLSSFKNGTLLLYLRGRIESRESGETVFVIGNDIELSRSWLRQRLRQHSHLQQIIILDCLETQFLTEWGEDLQLGSQYQQCIIAGASPATNPNSFAEYLLTTLENNNQSTGFPIAGWITQLQVALAGTKTSLSVWLSGAQGIIEVIPNSLGYQQSKYTPELDLGVCPYVGLRAFSATEAQYFYGRERLTQRLIYELGKYSFLAVIGASGSGKSSVVHAGVMAQLRQGKQLPGSDQWWIKSLRPGANPIQSLAQCLASSEKRLLEIEGLLHLGVDGFVRVLRDRPEPIVLLIIDQFEELFTLASEQEGDKFLSLLFGALEYAGDRFKILITLRADFIATALEYTPLSTYLQQYSILIPATLTEEDYRQIIIKPAEQVGLMVEPALVEVLCQELNTATSALPLLEFVLEQLWQYRTQGQLTLQAYQQQIGGIEGALERKAEAVYEQLNPAQKACAKWIFLALTQLGEGTEDTRRRVLKSALVVKKYPQPLVETTLKTLIEAKLIVVNLEQTQNAPLLQGVPLNKGEEISAQPLENELSLLKKDVTIEVAHEVLIRHWSTLRWWLEENRSRLQRQRQIENAAKLWHQNDKNPDFLLQGIRLAEAEEISIKYTDELSANVQEFIEAAIAQREEKQRQAKRQLRQAKAAVTTIGILGLAALGLGGFSYWQSQKVRVSEIETLNALSEALLTSNQQLEALIASTKAGKQLQRLSKFATSEELINNTDKILLNSVKKNKERNRLEGHLDSVTAVAFSPNETLIASASEDNTIKLWNQKGKEIRTLSGHQDTVTDVAFSPDGKILASASLDNTIKLWNLEGKELNTLKGHSSFVTSLSFSPNGKTLISGSANNTIKVWDLNSNELQSFSSSNPNSIITSIAISPNGSKILSGNTDGTVQLWEIEGELLQTFLGHTDEITDVAFSSQGNLIASASADKTVKIWHLNGTEMNTLRGHTDWVTAIEFSSNGNTIASASADNTIKIWHLTGEELETLQGHTAEVTDISFSPNTQILASSSADKTIRIWSLRSINIYQTLQGLDKPIFSVAFDSQGKRMASGSLDNTLKLWNLEGQELATFNGHNSWVTEVKFSPNNSMIASASQDNTIKLWNLDGTEIGTLKGHTKPVNSISFHPNGKIIVSGSDDTMIKLWKLDGTEIQTLQGHTKPVYNVAFSPNGERIASASGDKTIKLWNLDGKLLHTLNGHTDAVWRLSFSPNGERIASSSDDKTVKVWSSDGKLLATLTGHSAWVTDVKFSPNGQFLASASDDKTIRLWSVNSYQNIQTLQGHEAGVLSLAWSPEGNLLASGSFDNTVKLWSNETSELRSLTIDELLSRSCNGLRNYLQYNIRVKESDR